MSWKDQLELRLTTLPPPDHLIGRLRALGVPPSLRIETHANRHVLVSLSTRGALRVHSGFVMAPDEVLAAIARWARPRLRHTERRKAIRILLAFPVHQHVPPEREARRVVEAPRPGDDRILARLAELHEQINRRWFAGSLKRVTLLLSARMRRRLGEFRPAQDGRPAEIIIARRHLRRDGWSAVAETTTHEMVHQWQAESGRKLDHGKDFRRMCRKLGIDAAATRRLDRDLRLSFPPLDPDRA